MEKVEKNNWVGILFRVFIATGIVCFGVFRHLFGLSECVGSLLEAGVAISSKMALVIIHFVTVLELIVVVWTILGRINWGYISTLSTLVLMYSLSFIFSISNESFIQSDLSRINGVIGFPWVAAILIIAFYLKIKLNGLRRWVPRWAILLSAMVLISGYLIYYVPSFDQFDNKGGEYQVKYAKWDPFWEAVDEQQPAFSEESDYVICFFSTTCSHCNEAAHRIGVYQKINPDKKVLGVFFAKSTDKEFWNSSSVVDDFLKRNHLKIPYVKLVDYEAISISDNQFPVLIRMKNKKPKEIYVGGEVNAWAFDHLFL